MKKRLLPILFAGLMMGTSVPAQAMFSRGFSKAMTGLYWTIISVPTVVGTGNVLRLSHSFSIKGEPASEENKQFVREALRKQSVPQKKIKKINTINVESTCLGAYTAAAINFFGRHYIAVPKNITIEEKKLFEGLIGHEYGHIKNHDHAKDLLLRAGTSFALHYITPKSLLNRTSFMGNLLKPTVGYGNFALRILIVVSMGKCQEYLADKNSMDHCKDPKVLRATSKYFEELHKKKEAELKSIQATLSPKKAAVIRAMRHLDPHPKEITRARYFAKAAERLEKEQALAK